MKLQALRDCTRQISASFNESDGDLADIDTYNLNGKDSVIRVFGTYAQTDMLNPELQPLLKRGHECCMCILGKGSE